MGTTEPPQLSEDRVPPHVALVGLPFHNLRSTVLLLIFLALVPAAVFIIAHTNDRRAAAIEQAEQQQREFARRAATEYGKTLATASVLLKTISSMSAARSFDGARCRATLVEALQANPGFNNIGLVNADGQRVCAAVASEGEVDLADRPYFQGAMETNEFFVGEYQLGRVTDNAIVTFAHPIRNERGEATGIVYALVDVTALVDVASPKDLPAGTILSLFDRRGTVLARTEDDGRWVGTTVHWVADAFAALAGQPETDLRTTDRKGTEKVHVIRQIAHDKRGSGLYVSASVPIAVVTRAADTALTTGLLIVGALALITFGLAWFTSSFMLIRPVRRLIEEMHLLEAGELREPHAPVASQGELAELADAFERMVAGLQRRRAQRDRVLDALRGSHASLQAALEATQDGIFALDAGGTILRASSTAGTTLGLASTELEGRPFADAVLAPTSRARFEEAVRTADADPEGRPLLAPRTELRGVRGDGATVPLECTVTRVAGDGPDAYTLYMRDLTREKALTAQFLKAQKLEAVGQLTAGLAHDFNNALTVIRGHGQLLESELPESATDARASLGRIRHATLQAAALVKRTLLFSRRDDRPAQVIDVAQHIRRLMEFLPPLVGEHVAIRTDLQSEACGVRMDPGHLEQLLSNLAVNARDAMPSGGHITLRTAIEQDALAEHAGPCLVLEVSDDGDGIAAKDLPHVFEAFFSTKPAGEGTGLGLSSCREIVRLAGGSIEARSEPGAGTTIRVVLPGATEGPTEAPVPEDDAARLPGGDERILLAEDDPGVRELTFIVLRSFGYDVVRATDGEEAAALFRAAEAEGRPFDLLVTDLVMPRLDGETLADELAATHPDLPILYCSGHASRADALGGALRDFLAKPYGTHELLRKVRALLDRVPGAAAP